MESGKRRPATTSLLRSHLIGGHISVAGGLHQAPGRAADLGFRTMQIFVKNQRQWTAPPLDAQATEAFHQAVASSGLRTVVAHSAYLINLATPKDRLRQKSEDALVGEINRCAQLEIPALVLHPGSHTGSGEAQGLETVARALDRCIERAAGETVTIVLETTAGQGTALGWRLEHLATILDKVRFKDRLAICVDTCHVFAAGYDIANEAGWVSFWSDFDRLLGRNSLAVVHVNDAKKPAGSRVDRHEILGKGRLGTYPFLQLVEDPRFEHIPLIFETPEGEKRYAEEVTWWEQQLHGGAGSP